jgi:hypothetical protein
VRQSKPTGQLGTLDEDSRDGGTDGAETEERDSERGFRLWTFGSGLSALSLRFWTLGLRHCSTVYKLLIP